MDDHIMRHGTIGSWQSAATSEIVKCCWSRVHSCKCRYSKCPDLYLDLYRLGFHVTFLVCSANHVVFTSPPVQTGRSRNVFYCPFVRPSVRPLQNLWTQYFENEWTDFDKKWRNWSAWHEATKLVRVAVARNDQLAGDTTSRTVLHGLITQFITVTRI